jgi:hypothetical protein
MQPEFEAGRDTEVAAASAYAPEQFLVLLGAGMPQLSVGCDQVNRDEVSMAMP